MSFIEKLENLEEKIYKIIGSNVEKIKKGYEVVEYKVYDKSFYSCSEILCNNGFKGSIWDIEKPLIRDLEEYKQSIKQSGFLINNIHFFINIDRININDFTVNDIEVILLNKNNT